MANWYVNLQGFEIGPISDEELKELVASQKLDRSGSVRREDETEWIKAKKIPGLFPSEAKELPKQKSSQGKGDTSPVIPQIKPTLNRDAFPPTVPAASPTPKSSGASSPEADLSPGEPTESTTVPMAKPAGSPQVNSPKTGGKIRPMLTRCTHSGCRRYMLAAEFATREIITCLICKRPFQAVPVKPE